MAESRKEMGELVSLYELEPELKDIYVEGLLDKDLFEWFLSRHGRDDISVYPIDVVDIPNSVLQQCGLNEQSNRSKVIALSYSLSRSAKIKASVLCIADRDYEDFLPKVTPNNFLRFTDFHSFESYLLTTKTVQKFFTIVLGHPSDDCSLLLSQMKRIVRRVFFIRVTNEALEWGMTWINCRRYLKISRNMVTFDENKFIEHYLMTNGRIAQMGDFLDRMRILERIPAKDERLLIRGHDIIEILHLITCKLKSKRSFGDLLTFGGAFLGCLEPGDLTRYSLFQTLLDM
jgi:hypothetical protein